MEIKGINILIGGFIGTAEAKEVRHNDSGPGLQKYRDHPAEQKGPGGLAMQTEKSLFGIGRAKIKVMTT